MYRKLTLIAAGICCLALADKSSAENTVALESKLAAPGATGVTVGIYMTNDESIFSFSLPFEIRSVSGGAFPTGSIDFSVNAQGRLAGVAMAGATLERYYPTADANSCSGPISNTYSGHSSPNFISPDGLLWFPIFSPCFPAGSDEAPGADIPSGMLTFNVGLQEGVFEIDTCCIQNTHLQYNRCNLTALPVTSFIKSIITVTDDVCNLTPQDVNCDGVIDIFDVVQVVNAAFRNEPPSPPCCVP